MSIGQMPHGLTKCSQSEVGLACGTIDAIQKGRHLDELAGILLAGPRDLLDRVAQVDLAFVGVDPGL